MIRKIKRINGRAENPFLGEEHRESIDQLRDVDAGCGFCEDRRGGDPKP